MAKDFFKVVQAWVPPLYVHRVFALLMEHMENTKEPPARPWITGFVVLDDRGGSGCYLFRFNDDQKDVTMAQLRKIIGKDITVTMEDR